MSAQIIYYETVELSSFAEMAERLGVVIHPSTIALMADEPRELPAWVHARVQMMNWKCGRPEFTHMIDRRDDRVTVTTAAEVLALAAGGCLHIVLGRLIEPGALDRLLDIWCRMEWHRPLLAISAVPAGPRAHLVTKQKLAQALDRCNRE